MNTAATMSTSICQRSMSRVHECASIGVRQNIWTARRLHKAFAAKRVDRVHVQMRASATKEKPQRMEDDSEEIHEEFHDGLNCYTTIEGILLCSRETPESKFLVRRLEDTAEMKGQGAMIENWFLEGHAANAYCEVANDGTLMCNLSEEGNYVIKELAADGKSDVGVFVVGCKFDDDGIMMCKEMSMGDL
mmetsp:Transcript_36989/g.62281  ORF Transcript_36989/g.62281 Transcript_36989/m.62281 type:complete len:190 (-) Transcript_36989:306-875(-)